MSIFLIWKAVNKHGTTMRPFRSFASTKISIYYLMHLLLVSGGTRAALLAGGRSLLEKPRSRNCCYEPKKRPSSRDEKHFLFSVRDGGVSSRNNNEEIRDTKLKELRDARTLSLAPMMDYTDRHFRHLVRLVSNRTLLYSEMVVASNLCRESLEQKEAYSLLNPSASEDEVCASYGNQYLRRYVAQGGVAPLEGPSVLQLGGSDPETMHRAARIVAELTERGWCDYTAINLNCGCPSPRVAGRGCFGAALMDEPSLVADLAKAVHDGCGGTLPVTVKCRIGTDTIQPFSERSYGETDPNEEYGRLRKFVEAVASNGIVDDFSVHARIAVLSSKASFSPADNRRIPPLRYGLVRRLAREHPHLAITLNGGVDSLCGAEEELRVCPELAGVMAGRGWAADPWSFAMADRILYKEEEPPNKNRLQLLVDYGRHADAEEAIWDNPLKVRRNIVKAVTPLFAGEPRAKSYRMALEELVKTPKAEGKNHLQPPISELIVNCATKHLSEETLLRTPEESYERMRWKEEKKRRTTDTGGSSIRTGAIKVWDSSREDSASAKTMLLGSGDSSSPAAM